MTVNTSGTGCTITQGNPTYVLSATGETLAQVQNRILQIGATINGVTVIKDSTSVPLFSVLPGYALFNLRGGFTLNENSKNENSKFFVAFEHIFDNFYRHPSWGIDGAGRSLLLQYRYKF